MDQRIIELLDEWGGREDRGGKGGRARLAEALGINRQAIFFWERVPIRHLDRIEKLTGIPREDLRPDIFRAPRHARKKR
jgi:Bacterial toxin YdaS